MKKTKSVIILLLITLSLNGFGSDKIKVPVFGEIPFVQKGDLYSLDLGKLGKFSFKGSIDPLSLSTSVGIDDLKMFPGATVMSVLGLQDIEMTITSKAFEIAANIDDKFKDEIVDEVKKIKVIAPVIETVFNTLEIRSSRASLTYNLSMELVGALDLNIYVFGSRLPIPKVEGAIDPVKIVKAIASKIEEVAKDELAKVAKEVAKVASAAADASISIAKAGYDGLGYYAKHATTWKDHATHGSFGNPSCYNKCVPDRARKLSTPVFETSNQAVKEFYNKVYPRIDEIAGRSLREQYIKAEWERLTSSIDNNWENIIKDDHYKGFDKDQADVEKLGRRYRELVRAKKQEHVDYRNELWNELLTEKHFMFFENGFAEIYKVAANGSLGLKVNSVDGTWRTTWSEIEYYRAGGKDLVLFYQQADGGYAEMYEKGENGSLGRKVSSTKNWMGTWHDIEYYSAGAQDFMLFYQQTGGGLGALYKLKPDGTLGDRIALAEGWRGTWHDIEYYRAGDRNMMLFYQQAGGGSAELYEINNDGTLGAMVASTNNWLANWTDIEYFRAGGKDFLLFYQQSTGLGVVYEVAANGGLGRKVHESNSFRKTWTEIEFY